MPRSPTSRPSPPRTGLPELRRRGAVTELLFLFACTKGEPTQLRPIAEELELTVQAASHVFRQLQTRGLAEVVEGRYRPTLRGVAWLHAALGVLKEDVEDRLAHLNVVRSCRALALADLEEGAAVSLVLKDGLLAAGPDGGGASRGRVRVGARAGELVEIDHLEGILPIARGTVRILAVPARRLHDRALRGELKRALAAAEPSLLAAQGLEAFHLVSRIAERPVVRFAVASACREASLVGVGAMAVVLDEELPHLLQQFEGRDAPPLVVTTLG